MISHFVRVVVNGTAVKAGVGFAHQHGVGVSLKFDIYPGDDEKDISIIVRERGSAPSGSIDGMAQVFDLCQVKERPSYHSGVWNKWTKIGHAYQHKDGRGYTLEFDMRPSRASVEAGGNLVIREPMDEHSHDHSCHTCGRP